MGSLFARGLLSGPRCASVPSRGYAGSPSDGRPSKHCATLDLSRGLRMDENALSISPHDLYAQLGTASAPTIVDVRRSPPEPATGRMIVSASHRPPEAVAQWTT